MWYFSLFLRKKSLKYFAVEKKAVPLHRNQTIRGFKSKDNPISYIRLHVLTICDATTLPKIEGRNDGYSHTIVYAAHGYHIATY